MSQIAIGITDEQLRAVDQAAARAGKSREEFARAALETALAKPRFGHPIQPAAVAKPIGADKKEE